MLNAFETAESAMPNRPDTCFLVERFRRDADATSMPEYADLMRRAADELEAFLRLQALSQNTAVRRAG
jgi:hypothetical protein